MHTEEVVTRRGAMFYFSIGIAIVFLGGMAALLFAIGIDEGSWGMPLGGCLILLVTWYLVRGYYRNAPKVRVSYIGITWRGHTYMWDEVNSIALTGSQPMRMLGGKDMEGTAIVLNNGEKIILLDGMYSNLGAVRQLIAQAAPGKVNKPWEARGSQSARPAVRDSAVMPASVVPESGGVQFVRGNSIMNMPGVFAWIFVIGAVIGSVVANNAGLTVFLMLFALGFGALFTMFINYFGVSGDSVIVRNVYRPWKRKEYPLADIQQVIFASNHNGYNVMRLIFNDYRFKEFVGAGLSDSDWLALLQVMRGRGVEVKDENDFEKWVKPEMKKWKRKMVLYLLLWFVVLLVTYMWLTSLDVSDNTMITLKVAWLVFIILSFIGVIRFVVRIGAKDESPDR